MPLEPRVLGYALEYELSWFIMNRRHGTHCQHGMSFCGATQEGLYDLPKSAATGGQGRSLEILGFLEITA